MFKNTGLNKLKKNICQMTHIYRHNIYCSIDEINPELQTQVIPFTLCGYSKKQTLEFKHGPVNHILYIYQLVRIGA